MQAVNPVEVKCSCLLISCRMSVEIITSTLPYVLQCLAIISANSVTFPVTAFIR
jgi:hypothetical protein